MKKYSTGFKTVIIFIFVLAYALAFVSQKTLADEESSDIDEHIVYLLPYEMGEDGGRIQNVIVTQKVDKDKTTYDITVDVKVSDELPSAWAPLPPGTVPVVSYEIRNDFQRSGFQPQAKAGTSLQGKPLADVSTGVKRFIFQDYEYKGDGRSFVFYLKEIIVDPSGTNTKSVEDFGPLNFRVPQELMDKNKPVNPPDPGIPGVIDPPIDPVVPDEKKQIASLKPHLLVTSYSYGKNAVTSGQTFTVEFTLKNHSKNRTIQNVVLKMTPSEGLEIRSESNTIYIEKLIAGDSFSGEVTLKLPVINEKDVCTVTLDAKFQYYDKTDEDPAEGEDQTIISVPTAKIQRSKIANITMPKKFKPAREGTVEYGVINNGFAKIYNAEVFLYDEDEKEIGWEFLGNLDPGAKTEGKKMQLTFPEGGSKKCTMVLNYEDENLAKKTDKKDFEIKVEMPAEEEMPGDPMPPMVENPEGYPVDENGNIIYPEENKTSGIIKYVGIGVGVLALLTIAFFVNKKRKAKKSKSYDDYFDKLPESEDVKVLEES